MKTKAFEIDSKYIGIDADLKTSLFEYGLVMSNIGNNEYQFLYGVDIDSDTGEYCEFDCGVLDLDDIKSFFKDSTFDLTDVNKLCDSNYSEKTKLKSDYSVLQFIYDLKSYYGIEELFGGSYFGRYKNIKL